MISSIWIWVGFNLLVLIMLAIDLGLFSHHEHEIHFREALRRSGIWIVLALMFGVGIYLWRGPDIGLQFFTGYLIEESLSVDNLFVMLTIFTYFRVPRRYQHKVLFWGIIGALIMRGIFILAGVALIERFYWIIYLFGTLLVVTGVKMAFEKEPEIHPEQNPVLKLFRRVMPVAGNYAGSRFFVREAGKRMATPLMVVLVLIESTDLIFAVDSVPAVLSVSRDPFIVYTSNVFAILGLRSLYFALAGLMHRFHYLHYGLSVILIFVGSKMLLTDLLHVPILLALGVVISVLVISIVASLCFPSSSAASTPLPDGCPPPPGEPGEEHSLENNRPDTHQPGT